ncbi:MAG: hypothetical protein ACLFVP_08750 [Candidatus Bathyarchaeia archaeon]
MSEPLPCTLYRCLGSVVTTVPIPNNADVALEPARLGQSSGTYASANLLIACELELHVVG